MIGCNFQFSRPAPSLLIQTVASAQIPHKALVSKVNSTVQADLVGPIVMVDDGRRHLIQQLGHPAQFFRRITAENLCQLLPALLFISSHKPARTPCRQNMGGPAVSCMCRARQPACLHELIHHLAGCGMADAEKRGQLADGLRVRQGQEGLKQCNYREKLS